MTNYDGEKEKRLRGSMAPKTDDEVALAGTNSGETTDKEEALAGTNSGEAKEVAMSGSNAVEEEPTPEKHPLKEEIEEVVEEAKEKFDAFKAKHKE
ncbi:MULTISPECIES: rRNA processing protein [Enterococcus]|uniref:rRNA processing protein n=1 Tax=Candidatus Enterococcus mangumiae TaxID=2230878 RepID=A0ABZ2SZ62_9ENTE|nr:MULTISPECIES: rRNA processing protein [unclassified Enterococcus]MBO0462242.1 rRNA processing protein [Enterococcus sp. DIV1298c]MBO0489016.1 rRNA processing protein [Enterococcus sp. DIV1094]MBO1299177.1 rRNA processing protein [Enterococcus sp. DIV1271a]